MKLLSERVALVAGGTRGIDRTIVKILLKEDGDVAIGGREQTRVAQAAAELHPESGGKVKGELADVRNHDQVGELFRFVDAHLGGLDILGNHAGVGVFRPAQELTVEDWKSAIETNLSGAFYPSREALFRFEASHSRKETRTGGTIVNISSLAGAQALAGGAAYNASRFDLNGLFERVESDAPRGQDVRGDNVRVSYVIPGSVIAGGFGSQDAPSDAGTNLDQPSGSPADETERFAEAVRGGR